MRIKFLSVIVSFLFVSMATTSCLDNNENIEYSPDATIKVFEIDTIHGITYNFTINQFGTDGMGLIYNQDSLPLGADTIINRILIANMTTASGIVTSKNGAGLDTLLNLSDSMDLRKPIIVKVWSLEAYANGEINGPTKQYKIQVNVHKQDPDSMLWAKMTNLPSNALGAQKAVILKNGEKENIFVYTANAAYKGEIINKGASISWETISSDLNGLPNSLLNRNDTLFATANNILYYSEDGATWKDIPTLNSEGDIVTLVAVFKESLSAVISYPGGKKYFNKVGNILNGWVKGQEVPTDFPSTALASTTYITATGIEQSMVVGNQSLTKYTVPWMATSDNDGWGDLENLVEKASCPYLNNPSIIHYNGALYAFGGDFSKFYKSMSGIAWYGADSKFWMPAEFKNKGDYSMVVGKNNHIWIIWSTGEVWRGRLNKLGFEAIIR